MDKATYTLDAARRELQRRECADGGHRPYHHMIMVGERIGHYSCECGEISWAPTR